MDGIELEILWSNLISIVSEQAKALQRIAFSPVVREAGDLANALFDTEGRMVAQAITGTPGHINSLAAAGKHFVKEFPPETLHLRHGLRATALSLCSRPSQRRLP